MAISKDDLLEPLANVLKELEDHRNDPQLQIMMGALVTALLERTTAQNWKQFKKHLSAKDYNRLLEQFELDANKYLAEDNRKAAIAVQIVTFSLIASRVDDEQINGGEDLLDRIIEPCIPAYRAFAKRKAAAK